MSTAAARLGAEGVVGTMIDPAKEQTAEQNTNGNRNESQSVGRQEEGEGGEEVVRRSESKVTAPGNR